MNPDHSDCFREKTGVQ